MKVALLIGINYKGTSSALNGCINDVHRIKEFLLKKGYKEENICLISDDTDIKPTCDNILNQINELVSSAHKTHADEMFMHYSGHGGHIRDTNGDEEDRQDETLIPLDYKKGKVITDDQLNSLISRKPDGCRFTGIFDCCHSGTVLDLKYLYRSGEENFLENKTSQIKAPAVMLSGCMDSQTSADAMIDNKWCGALTASFLECYVPEITCLELLTKIRTFMTQHGYAQIPQISSADQLSAESQW